MLEKQKPKKYLFLLYKKYYQKMFPEFLLRGNINKCNNIEYCEFKLTSLKVEMACSVTWFLYR